MATKSKAALATLTLTRLTPNEFRAELKRKGWTYVELGERWGMSANWLAKVGGREDRPRYWDDAVRGLPNRLDVADEPRSARRSKGG